MTCPYCGAYSPKNTATCNRCRRRLPLLENQRELEQQRKADGSVPASAVPEHEGYGYGYRQPEQTRLGVLLEKVGTFIDTYIIEDPAGWKCLLAAVAAIVLVTVMLCTLCDCGGCSSGCSDGEMPAYVSVSDVSCSDVSPTDVSSTDLSSTDAPADSR